MLSIKYGGIWYIEKAVVNEVLVVEDSQCYAKGMCGAYEIWAGEVKGRKRSV
jgi:hypothetical protein